MSTAIVNTQKATVRPYIDPNANGMGLAKYGQSVFDGIGHEEPITYLEAFGVGRFVTGLDEFAPEVDSIANSDDKAAKILEIRKSVAYLEQRMGGATQLDPDDANFWSKVKVLTPTNKDFWGRITMICGNDPVTLEPLKDPKDLIKLVAIKAGSFSMIAPSLLAAKQMDKVPQFYLDEHETTLSLNTELKKLRNKAGALLENLFEKNQNKLFYVAKVIDGNSAQYRKNTSPDVFYDNMDKFLEGTLDANISKRKNAEKFIDICGLDMETLKLRSIIKDANFVRLISARSDGMIYHMATSTPMGKTPTEALAFLQNPLNDNVLRDLTAAVEALWK